MPTIAPPLQLAKSRSLESIIRKAVLGLGQAKWAGPRVGHRVVRAVGKGRPGLVHSGGCERAACSTFSQSALRCRLAPPRAGAPVTRGVRHAPLRAQQGLPERMRGDVRKRAGKCRRAEGWPGPVGLGVRPLLHLASEPPDGDERARGRGALGTWARCSEPPAPQPRPPTQNPRPWPRPQT